MILRSKFVQYFGLAFKISFKGYFLESFHANYVEAFSKMVSLTLCTFKHFQSFSKSFKVILECLSTMAMLNLNVLLVHCYFHCGNKCNARLSFLNEQPKETFQQLENHFIRRSHSGKMFILHLDVVFIQKLIM